MTYSLGASGTVDEVKNVLESQANQYVDDAVGHVKDLLHKVLDIVQAPHGVSVSAQGHGSPGGFSANISVVPAAPPTPSSPPPSDPAPVS